MYRAQAEFGLCLFAHDLRMVVVFFLSFYVAHPIKNESSILPLYVDVTQPKSYETATSDIGYFGLNISLLVILDSAKVIWESYVWFNHVPFTKLCPCAFRPLWRWKSIHFAMSVADEYIAPAGDDGETALKNEDYRKSHHIQELSNIKLL